MSWVWSKKEKSSTSKAIIWGKCMEVKSRLHSEGKKIVWMDEKEDSRKVVERNEAGERSWYWIMMALKSLIPYQCWNIKGNAWEPSGPQLHQPRKKKYCGRFLSLPSLVGPSPHSQYLLRRGKSAVLGACLDHPCYTHTFLPYRYSTTKRWNWRTGICHYVDISQEEDRYI